MFGRTAKIRKAIDKSLRSALAGNDDDAFAPIRKLRPEEKVDAYVDLCHQLIYEEDLEAADAAIDQALELAPEDLYVLDAKSEVAVEDGRSSDALAIYRKMYELAPDDPEVVSGLAALYLRNGDSRAALELLAAWADSEEPKLQLRRGEALFAADRPEEALAILEQLHRHYQSSLKQASFVDNVEDMVARLDEVSRMRDAVLAELQGSDAPAKDE